MSDKPSTNPASGIHYHLFDGVNGVKIPIEAFSYKNVPHGIGINVSEGDCFDAAIIDNITYIRRRLMFLGCGGKGSVIIQRHLDDGRLVEMHYRR